MDCVQLINDVIGFWLEYFISKPVPVQCIPHFVGGEARKAACTVDYVLWV